MTPGPGPRPWRAAPWPGATSAPGSRLITSGPGLLEPGDLALHPAVHGPPEPAVGAVGAAVGGRHGRDDDDEVEPLVLEHVGVGGRVHAAVDVLGAPDVDRLEIAGNGARGQDGGGQAGRRGAGPAEDDPRRRRSGGRRRCAGRRASGSPMCSSRPRARSEMSIWPRGSSVMAATSGRKARGRRTVRTMRAGEGRFQGRSSERTDGRRERPGVGGEDAAQDGATPARGGRPVERGRQVRGGHADAERRAGDRAGGGADDDGGLAWVPAGLALEGGQDAGLVGLADDAAGAEHQPDGRGLPAREPATDDLHHGPFYPAPHSCAGGAAGGRPSSLVTGVAAAYWHRRYYSAKSG